MEYAEVAVNSPVSQHRTFTYSVPADMLIMPGQAVWVPFGARTLQGIIFDISQSTELEETRDIISVIDSKPLLASLQLKLANWISEYYAATLFESAALMLPPGFEQRSIALFSCSLEVDPKQIESLADQQKRVLAIVQQHGEIGENILGKLVGRKSVKQILTQLVRKKLLLKQYVLEPPKVKPKVIHYIKLLLDKSDTLKEVNKLAVKAPVRAAILKWLAEKNELVAVSDLYRYFKYGRDSLKQLTKDELVKVEAMDTPRDPLAGYYTTPVPAPELTQDQLNIWDEIKQSLSSQTKDRPAIFLLHGVTSSGKTEIYLRALAEMVKIGKRGIVLVPEISLTPQTIERFYSRFPGKVAVLHSNLSIGEQYDEWYKIRQGEFDVVIGSRSAIFAPQPDLGLIVIDEEHEWTYKEVERSPRYHARDVAIRLAEDSGATTILGSATPSMESYYNTLQGKYRLLKLPHRITPRGDTTLPEVEIVDLRRELKKGNRSIFSMSLRSAVQLALDSNEQAILFLNRRGSATMVQCRKCGFVVRCKRCDISMTYHSTENTLICHQCNFSCNPPFICPQCSSPQIKYLGAGTQRVEELTQATFPGANTIRWDSDTTRRKGAHLKIIQQFASHQANILIGTQMIAKGLDLPLVTLVGIICADTSLHLPDFRAAERTFQLVSQVAGRAGRGIKQGKVIVQTFSPDHYAIISAASHDFEGFYNRELNYRQQLGNPPFSKLVKLVYQHTNSEACQKEATRVKNLLVQEKESRSLSGVSIIGPTSAFIQRVRGRYRWQIFIKGNNPTQLLKNVPLPQGWIVDIDPATVI